MQNNTIFSGINGIRGLASIWVLFHHLVGSNLFNNNLLEPLLTKGWIAVDLFFIISGFIMAHVYGGHITKNNIKKYYILRLARIYPLHLFVLISTLLPIILVSMFFKLDYPEDNFTFLKFIYQIFLLHGIGINNSLGWNYASWSISSEFIAYLLFPLLSYIFFTKYKIKNCFVPIIIIMIIIAGTLSISLLLEHKQYILSWNLIIIRVISEFTIGILIFILYKNSNIKITYITLLNNLSFIGIIILPFIIENSIFDFLYIILFCILIFTSSYNCTGLVNYILNHQYIKYLGKISYTIYIIHIPCLIITKVLMQYILNKYEILSSYQNILIIIPVIFIILISNFLYNNIEKYCQEYIKNILK